MAHAIMLAKIGILTDEELNIIKKGLKEIYDLWKKGKFHIEKEDEDVHTRIENYLTEKYGEPGQKIHTGRSRNDQVLLDLRLYMKDELLEVSKEVVNLLYTLLHFSKKYLLVPMPGYTHTRIAMPGSVGLWSHALFEALFDEINLIIYIYNMIDQSPLGSAAGYGVPLPLDRELVSDLLGFSRVQKNVIYTQNSRGMFELLIVGALERIMLYLSRYAQDLIYFTMPQFGYFTLPLEILSGSSIMPQKQNPDMLELMRAKTMVLSSWRMALSGIVAKLPTGYARDLQLTKGYLMSAIDTTKESIKVINKVFEGLKVNEDALKKDMPKEIFATDYALSMVEKEGVPFRTAYREVAKNLDNLTPLDPEQVIKERTHLGTTGDLRIDEDRKKLIQKEKKIEGLKEEYHKTLKTLLDL